MRVLVLSPHRDDAAFSCGLLMLLMAGACADLTVVNVCTRSDYAPYLEPDGRDRATQVTSARALEDERFAEEITALASVTDPVRWIDLQWQDAPLRLGVATESVVQQRSGEPADTPALVAALCALPPADMVLAPLALGDHIDHRLVREAARQVYGERTIFYEDLPYACRMSPEERLSLPASLLPAGLRAWSAAPAVASGSKRRLAMCYPSQIAPDVAEEMEAYAATLHGSERFYGAERSLRLLEVCLKCGAA